MQYQDSIRRLEQIEAGFQDATASLTQIFTELKLITPAEIPEIAPRTVKFAASAAVIAEIEAAMHQAAAGPDQVEVAIQLGKIGEKVRIALPGGAVHSTQELAWIAEPANDGKPAPANLFYQLAQTQLMTTGEIGFTYDLDLATESFTAALRTNLARQLGEELGQSAAQRVKFGEFLPGEQATTLTTLKLPDPAAAAHIAATLQGRGVTIDETSTLKGIYTVVTERVAVAHAPVTEIERLATDNAKAVGMRVKTLAELLTISAQTAESVDSFRNFKAKHGDRHGTDGIRNPSTTWGLSLLARWLKERLIASEPPGSTGNPLP